MQQIILDDLHDKSTKPRDRAALAKAWDILEERKRILKMKPKPRDIDTTRNLRKNNQARELAFSAPPAASS